MVDFLNRLMGRGLTVSGQSFMQIGVEATGDASWACHGEILRGYWRGGSDRLQQAVAAFWGELNG